MNVTIITDASYCPSTGAAGFGYWIASGRGKEGGGGPMKGRVTGNGAAEMMAVCNAVCIALARELVQNGDELLVQTDSLAAIFAFQGSRKLKDLDEIRARELLHDLQYKRYLRIKYRHVKGHTRNTDARSVTNVRCDERAKKGMKLARAVLSATPDDDDEELIEVIKDV